LSSSLGWASANQGFSGFTPTWRRYTRSLPAVVAGRSSVLFRWAFGILLLLLLLLVIIIIVVDLMCVCLVGSVNNNQVLDGVALDSFIMADQLPPPCSTPIFPTNGQTNLRATPWPFEWTRVRVVVCIAFLWFCKMFVVL
jgi:hypothetical protein